MHTFITYVADRAATREVEALADFHGLGLLILSGELKYDTAKTQLVEAFDARGLSSSTAKTYLSQGHSLAQLFPTFEDVEEFADDKCNGSRSLKRIYDAVKVSTPKAKTPMIDVILANLATLKDPAEIGRVIAAADAMLVVIEAAALAAVSTEDEDEAADLAA